MISQCAVLVTMQHAFKPLMCSDVPRMK